MLSENMYDQKNTVFKQKPAGNEMNCFPRINCIAIAGVCEKAM